MSEKRQGFTLVELLIVVTIIGILAVIAIPQLSVYKVRGHNSASLTDIRTFKIAIESYYVDNKRYP